MPLTCQYLGQVARERLRYNAGVLATVARRNGQVAFRAQRDSIDYLTELRRVVCLSISPARSLVATAEPSKLSSRDRKQ